MDIEAEQLIYGSFPFRAGGYDLLARSAGCSPGVTAEVVAVCRRFGQPPSGEAARAALFAVRLPSGAWAVVGVAPQGTDDRGRPGALGFHALIVTPWDYRRAGANPFAFAAAHRGDWSSATPSLLPRARCAVEVAATTSRPVADLKTRRIVQALEQGRRIAVETPDPIDDLARAVWASLPARVRRRAAVATWAFANENRFDLVAFPRLAGIALDSSYVPPAALDAPEPPPGTALRKRLPIHDIKAPGSVTVAWAGMLVVVALTLGWAWGNPRIWRRGAAPVAVMPVEPLDEAPPELVPVNLAQVQTGLAALADRFAAFDVGPATDPTQLLTRLADALHYHGRLLTPAERVEITRDPSPDKVRALLWHDVIQRFRDDQPWPGNFGEQPVAEQLRAVARSFHLDPGLPADQVPAALIAALARPGLVQPTPLAARFPALSEYARFLGKLPRLDDPPTSGTER